MITLQITDSIDSITKQVNAAIAQQINKTISDNKSKIQNEVKSLVRSWVAAQPEIISLRGNLTWSLAGQFGIPENDTAGVISAILSAIENSISINFVPYNDKLRGGLEINIQPSTFANLLGLSQGHVRYAGGDLHWLNWLLTQGDRIIVAHYQYNAGTGLGRSGLGNMVPGVAFRVQPEYSGTEDNNFITRALIGTTQEKAISDIIYRILQ